MNPPKQNPLDVLAATLRQLAKLDAYLDGNENSTERMSEWRDPEFKAEAIRLAQETCSTYTSAIEQLPAVKEWPDLHLNVLEELESFNYASIRLPERYLEFPESFNGSENIVYEGVIRACEFCSERLFRLAARIMVHARIKNPRTENPTNGFETVNSANDERDRFMYTLKIGGETHSKIIRLVHEKFNEILKESGVREAINRYCDRKGIERPARRKRRPN